MVAPGLPGPDPGRRGLDARQQHRPQRPQTAEHSRQLRREKAQDR